jgi:small subunit ribosomal protein S3Ae
MAAKKQTKKIVKKKKKWLDIIAPKIFKEHQLGQTIVFDDEEAIGRVVKVNLMTLLRDPKKQNINVAFQVEKIDAGKAYTTVYGYELISSSIKRLVKRRKDKIDDSFVCQTKDKKLIRVKPMLITNGKTNNSVITTFRKKCRYLFAKNIEKMTLDDLVSGIIFQKFLFQLKDELKKIYPLKSIEVKKISIEKRKNAKPINPQD